MFFGHVSGEELMYRRLLTHVFFLLIAACASTEDVDVPGPEPAWLVNPAAGGAFRAPGPVDLSGELALSNLIGLAAERNPRLAAARQRWLAAAERPAQARSLPDPLFAYTEMVDPIETRVGPMDRQFKLTQPIPYPGKLSAAGSLAEEEARVRELDYYIAVRDTVAAVKVTYTEFLYLRKALLIVEQNRELARQLAEKSAAIYAKAREENRDVVTLFDSLKAQSQLAQLAYDTITLEELMQTEAANLNRLVSRAPEAPLGMPLDLRFRRLNVTRDALFRLALERRQELQAALRRIAAAMEAERLARLARVPDFAIGATYSVIGQPLTPQPGGGNDALGLTLGLSLPIWVTKNRARIAEAEHRLQASQYERQAEIDDLMARITKVFFRLQNAERLVRLYKESLIPQAEEAMEIAEQWRDVGRDTIGRYLEAQSVWLNFQLAYHRALADHEQAIARLEQLVGTSLGHLRGEEQKHEKE
jgi:outer membrane protein TolC